MNLKTITIAKKHINLFSAMDLKTDSRRIAYPPMAPVKLSKTAISRYIIVVLNQ